MRKLACSFLCLLGLGLGSGAAHAVPLFEFDLSDSVAGGVRPPNYGLRLDGLYSGKSNDIYTFSFVDVTMLVDSTAGTAALGGTLLGGSEGDGENRDTNWFFDFLYTDLDVDASDGSWEFVKDISGGTGSITNAATSDVFALAQFMGSDGFAPHNDGVSCRNGDGPWCGNGWLNHSVIPGSTDTSTHHYSSDFLFNGTPVPEPSVIALLGIGAFGLGIARRRRLA